MPPLRSDGRWFVLGDDDDDFTTASKLDNTSRGMSTFNLTKTKDRQLHNTGIEIMDLTQDLSTAKKTTTHPVRNSSSRDTELFMTPPPSQESSHKRRFGEYLDVDPSSSSYDSRPKKHSFNKLSNPIEAKRFYLPPGLPAVEAKTQLQQPSTPTRHMPLLPYRPRSSFLVENETGSTHGVGLSSSSDQPISIDIASSCNDSRTRKASKDIYTPLTPRSNDDDDGHQPATRADMRDCITSCNGLYTTFHSLQPTIEKLTTEVQLMRANSQEAIAMMNKQETAIHKLQVQCDKHEARICRLEAQNYRQEIRIAGMEEKFPQEMERFAEKMNDRVDVINAAHDENYQKATRRIEKLEYPTTESVDGGAYGGPKRKAVIPKGTGVQLLSRRH